MTVFQQCIGQMIIYGIYICTIPLTIYATKNIVKEIRNIWREP